MRSLFTECSQALDAAILLTISTDIAYYHRDGRGYAHKQVPISLNLRTKSCYKLCGNPICALFLAGICSSLFRGVRSQKQACFVGSGGVASAAGSAAKAAAESAHMGWFAHIDETAAMFALLLRSVVRVESATLRTPLAASSCQICRLRRHLDICILGPSAFLVGYGSSLQGAALHLNHAPFT